MFSKLIVPTELKPFIGAAKVGLKIATSVAREVLYQGCKITNSLVIYPICKGVVERLEAKHMLEHHRQEKEVGQEQKRIQQLLANKETTQIK
jgi:hypothetical protein